MPAPRKRRSARKWKLPRPSNDDTLFFGGLLSIGVGCWLAWPPLGFIVVGVLLVLLVVPARKWLGL